MDVYLLGAGRPSRGIKPAALKLINATTRAIDWQLHGFENLEEVTHIRFLGGYHVEEVIDRYPDLSVLVVPDWETGSVLKTFLSAPFSGDTVVVCYSDTVFRPHVIRELARDGGDFSIAIDSLWERRFDGRPQSDRDIAETVDLSQLSDHMTGTVEFAGLACFRPDVVEHLASIAADKIGTTLVDLVHHLVDQGFVPRIVDVEGHWAEFNEPPDLARFILGTKAETLSRLESIVQKSTIGRQVAFTLGKWDSDSESVLTEIQRVFDGARLVVRSSAAAEDGWKNSNAGRFESVVNVDGLSRGDVVEAIEAVRSSYRGAASDTDQILIQQFLENAAYAGVVLTRSLATGAPYYCINYDCANTVVDSVTSGLGVGLPAVVISRFQSERLEQVSPHLMPVLCAVRELEQLLGYDKLDVEFALSKTGEVFVFQVRPITVDHSAFEIEDDCFRHQLESSADEFEGCQNEVPSVVGERAIFGNMPDWNPAEIIGVQPRPLAYSLYRHLITDDIWAAQRADYGYRDVRSHPLIRSFLGQPYVDVRASFNSFVPADLPENTARRLVNAYLNILAENPELHDKVEFAVVLSAWTPDFRDVAEKRLLPRGMTSEDIDVLEGTLKVLTRNGLSRLYGDTAPLQHLDRRRKQTLSSDLSPLDRALVLLKDCKTLGTPAFCHAARAAFVATQMLRGFENCGVLRSERTEQFLHGIRTVSKEFSAVRSTGWDGATPPNDILERFGHLRPGTYEICIPAYWEAPDFYFSGGGEAVEEDVTPFEFRHDELSAIAGALTELESDWSPDRLISFIREAIEAREWVKLEFTRSLSNALDSFVELAQLLGITRDDFSFVEFADLEQYRLNALSLEGMRERMEDRKQQHLICALAELPPLLRETGDFYCFERHLAQPNFVSKIRTVAPVHVYGSSPKSNIDGHIVVIEQADPGYDWLMSRNISGLVTKYGGANSHMAIRAAETGLPAAIGVGTVLYERICRMRRLDLDCAGQVLREVE